MFEVYFGTLSVITVPIYQFKSMYGTCTERTHSVLLHTQRAHPACKEHSRNIYRACTEITGSMHEYCMECALRLLGTCTEPVQLKIFVTFVKIRPPRKLYKCLTTFPMLSQQAKWTVKFVLHWRIPLTHCKIFNTLQFIATR